MNILTPIKAFFSHLRDGAHQDPARDWLALITLSSIALAGLIVWNARTFDTVANGGVIGAPMPRTASIFDQAALNTVHTIFANRAAEEAKYRTGTYRFTDPSQ